jgi:putative ABC transport system permease protein
MEDILLVTSISPFELLTLSAIVLTITIISSLQPALKASRMEPVVALRHV